MYHQQYFLLKRVLLTMVKHYMFIRIIIIDKYITMFNNSNVNNNGNKYTITKQVTSIIIFQTNVDYNIQHL